jgi:hypothetical protein
MMRFLIFSQTSREIIIIYSKIISLEFLPVQIPTVWGN